MHKQIEPSSNETLCRLPLYRGIVAGLGALMLVMGGLTAQSAWADTGLSNTTETPKAQSQTKSDTQTQSEAQTNTTSSGTTDTGVAHTSTSNTSATNGKTTEPARPTPDTHYDLARAEVSVSNAEYTGEALTPEVVVKDERGATLKAGVHYTAVYKHNVLPGKAELTITGKAPYTGSLTKTFTITRSANNLHALPGSWKHNATGWWYAYKTGGYAKNQWLIIGGKTYHFNSSGYMDTRWYKERGAWYWLGNDGAMATGWASAGVSWYYLNPDGKMATGWKKLGDTWYYLRPSGSMVTGWQWIGGTWYYFYGSGAMATGWTWDGHNWYYLHDWGGMKTGWLKSGNTWYYLRSWGAMGTSWQWIGGNWYYFYDNGKMATGWLSRGSSWYYLKDWGGMAQSEWKWIKGVDYRFDSSGAMAGTWVQVPTMLQYPELPTGCESVALGNTLRYWGFNTGKTDIADKWLNWSSWDWLTSFAGNPHASGGNMNACAAPAIEIAGNKYLKYWGSDLRAHNRTGMSIGSFKSELSHGYPVIAWVTANYTYPSGSTAPQFYEGRAYRLYNNTHTVVVKGYNEERGVVYISDSISGDITVNIDTFFGVWASMGRQAIVVR